MQEGDPVRIALFGNSFGARIQLPALAWAGGNRVIGVAGLDLGKARETADAWRIPRATADWRTLLEEAPDLVLVSTPVDLHQEMTLAALESGAAVLCEKPFAHERGRGRADGRRGAGARCLARPRAALESPPAPAAGSWWPRGSSGPPGTRPSR